MKTISERAKEIMTERLGLTVRYPHEHMIIEDLAKALDEFQREIEAKRKVKSAAP